MVTSLVHEYSFISNVDVPALKTNGPFSLNAP